MSQHGKRISHQSLNASIGGMPNQSRKLGAKHQSQQSYGKASDQQYKHPDRISHQQQRKTSSSTPYYSQAQQGEQTQQDQQEIKQQLQLQQYRMQQQRQNQYNRQQQQLDDQQNQEDQEDDDDDFNIVRQIIQQFYEDKQIHYDSLLAFQKLNTEIQIYNNTWEHFFIDIVKCVLKCTEEQSPQINEFSWEVLKKIIQTQPQRVPIAIDTIIAALVDPQGRRAVIQGAQDVLQELISTQQSETVFKSMGRLLKKLEHPALQKLIKLITRMVQGSHVYQLSSDVHFIAQQLISKFEHQVPEVRKAVVFCLVEIHAKLGNSFEPYLESLSPSQQKLVTIYISRREDRLKGR